MYEAVQNEKYFVKQSLVWRRCRSNVHRVKTLSVKSCISAGLRHRSERIVSDWVCDDDEDDEEDDV